MIQYASLTDPGGREINEDSLACIGGDGQFCFILCDGLGGHGMGDAASRLVVEVFQDAFGRMSTPSRFLGPCFLKAQKQLEAAQKQLHAERKMLTTAVALVIDGKFAYIGHVGDSRLYVFRRGKIVSRTLDHSVPQMLALSGEIREDEIRHHADRSFLLRAMGSRWEKPMYELARPIRLKRGHAFLLCSDGFWELIEDAEMCDYLDRSASPEEWLSQMRAKIIQRGADASMDNYSAIAVWNVK